MGNAEQSFGEGFKNFYLPVLVFFFAVVAGGTCLSAGPFFPVGFSGIVILVLAVIGVWIFIKRRNENKSLQNQLDASYASLDSVTKKYKSDIVKKDERIKELEADVELLKAQVASLKKEAPAVLKVEDIIKEKKTSKKK